MRTAIASGMPGEGLPAVRALRVLCVTHSYGADGAAVTLRRAIRHWVELGWRVDALCSAATLQQYRGELADCGARPVRQADMREYDVALINSVLNVDKVDVLAAKAPALPIVLWVREGVSLLRHGDQAVSALVRQFSRCARVVYQTSWQRDEIFRSFTALMPPSRLAVVPNGVDIVQAPQPRGDAGGPFRVACIGSVNGRKRQGDLARAVQRLATEVAIECEFIGDLTHAASIGPGFMELVRRPPPALKWLGALPHAETLARLSGADLFCLPSSDESFASAPLEAATRGVPVLLSALPPYPYIGWRDGENCLQHPVGDVAQLEAHIRRMVNEPELRHRIAAAGKQLADNFPVETSLQMMTECVEAAARERAVR